MYSKYLGLGDLRECSGHLSSKRLCMSVTQLLLGVDGLHLASEVFVDSHERLLEVDNLFIQSISVTYICYLYYLIVSK